MNSDITDNNTDVHEYKADRSTAEGVGAILGGGCLVGIGLWLLLFSPISGAAVPPDEIYAGKIVALLVTLPLWLFAIVSIAHGIEVLRNNPILGSDPVPQVTCENGHTHALDAVDKLGENHRCPQCKAIVQVGADT